MHTEYKDGIYTFVHGYMHKYILCTCTEKIKGVSISMQSKSYKSTGKE